MAGTGAGQDTLRAWTCIAIAAGLWALTAPAVADGAMSDLDLAKASQNPLANLAGLPFRLNVYPNVTAQPGGTPENGGAAAATQTFKGSLSTVDINPTLPVPLGNGWLMLARLKMPVSVAHDTYQPDATQAGLGDINPSVYLTPGPWGNVTLGLGAGMQMPTATNFYLGQGKWAAGPALVGMWTPGPFVLGVLAQNVWSFAGPANRPRVSLFNIQPIFNYNLEDGWFITSQPYVTADWTAPSGQRWTLPLGGGLGRLVKLGEQPATIVLGAFGYPITPPGGPRFSLRLAVTFLFPK